MSGGGERLPNGVVHNNADGSKNNFKYWHGFQMPLHYPRYKKSDYEKMPKWKLDCLLKQYGLPVIGDADEKRKFAMGAFLWEW
ncbi:hypothetical protein M9H77_32556 [Catharanthus roseus]|uniref:Uncharacterized protein n=1 Tax=Catharanthus roseus TaxID=4058 RepID=A0ACC0A437_CATRO|nr:hypothetical protein M9H77_32556 [Catharanthus roseus]